MHKQMKYIALHKWMQLYIEYHVSYMAVACTARAAVWQTTSVCLYYDIFSGFNILKYITLLKPEYNIPVIYLTSWSSANSSMYSDSCSLTNHVSVSIVYILFRVQYVQNYCPFETWIQYSCSLSHLLVVCKQ